jgi:hypothetical protein
MTKIDSIIFTKIANIFRRKWSKWSKIVIITFPTGANPTTSEYTTATPALC